MHFCNLIFTHRYACHRNQRLYSTLTWWSEDLGLNIQSYVFMMNPLTVAIVHREKDYLGSTCVRMMKRAGRLCLTRRDGSSRESISSSISLSKILWLFKRFFFVGEQLKINQNYPGISFLPDMVQSLCLQRMSLILIKIKACFKSILKKNAIDIVITLAQPSI